jgi:GDPmannose 4,6-dehydratase
VHLPKRKALITGVTGQDGSHLADLLLTKDYDVHAIVRRCSANNRERIAHLKGKTTLHEGDLLDQGSLNAIVSKVEPDEVYNLAAQSHVGTSFTQPVFTSEVTGLGVLRMLEAIRNYYNSSPTAYVRFYQASSSEMFGDVAESPQHEQTELRGRSPYGVAKIFGHHMVKVYREAYGMHASCGILFNHEGPRRGLNFVTRKITRHVARQTLGLTTEPLKLGNLDAKRDWGHAEDYVRAMWLMLQQDKPDDYVIATGETHTVREFVEAAYQAALQAPKGGSIGGMVWRGSETEETGRLDLGCLAVGEEPLRADPLVKVNSKYYRPADVQTLTGDASKAREVLGWEPRHDFQSLVKCMVEADLEDLR